jgi:hypothetical protein
MKVEIIFGNSHFLTSNTYFLVTVMYLQYGFLYLIATRPTLTVGEGTVEKKHQ